jgi:hypothetical protein
MSSTLSGVGIQAEYADLFTSTTTAGGMQLGAKATTGDGREFRFILAGGVSLVAGTLLQTSAETTGFERLAVAAAAIGATIVTTTSTVTLTVNQLAGGYLFVSTTPGIGYTYRIVSNPAVTAAVVSITLEDPIIVALTASSQVGLVVNPFSGVIINPTTASGSIVGAAVSVITNAQYGWIQTTGPTDMLCQGTIVVGTQVAASSTTAGAVVATSGVLASVGFAMQGVTAGQDGPIFLNIS